MRRSLLAAVLTCVLHILSACGGNAGGTTGRGGKTPVDATSEGLLFATNSFLPYSLTRAEFHNRAQIETRLELVVELLVNGLRKT
jgi:hypothetical protein